MYEKRRRLTVDGFEMTMAVNHFAPFLLTHHLLAALTAAPVHGRASFAERTYGE